VWSIADIFFRRTVLLSLSRISREWRASVLADPVLWASTLAIHGGHRLKHLVCWMDRTGSSPLDLVFTDEYSLVVNGTTTTPLPSREVLTQKAIGRPMLELFTMYAFLPGNAGRIRSIVAALHEPSLQGIFLDSIFGCNKRAERFTSLTRLRLNIARSPGHAPEPHMASLQKPADHDFLGVLRQDLRALSPPMGVSSCGGADHLLSLRLSGQGYRFLDADMFQRMLTSCPNLALLFLDRVIASPPNDPPPNTARTAVVLDSLKTLEINAACYQREHHGVLELFDAPNIVELTAFGMGWGDFLMFAFYIAKRYPAVRNLHLADLSTEHGRRVIPDFLFVRWLAAMPHVETLRLDNVNMHYLQLLQMPVGAHPRLAQIAEDMPLAGSILLPRLRTFEIIGEHFHAIDSVWRTRRRMGVPLQQARFTASRVINAPVYEIRNNHQEGWYRSW
jgi:hypothetical protein